MDKKDGAGTHEKDTVKCFQRTNKFTDDECKTLAHNFCKEQDTEGRCKKEGKVQNCKWRNLLENKVSTCCANYTCMESLEKSKPEEKSLDEEGSNDNGKSSNEENEANLNEDDIEDLFGDSDEKGNSSNGDKKGKEDDEEMDELFGNGSDEGRQF